MYGLSMGTLDVIVNGINVWSMSGDQGNSWHQAQVDLSSLSTGIYFIEIKHQLGSGRIKVIKQ